MIKKQLSDENVDFVFFDSCQFIKEVSVKISMNSNEGNGNFYNIEDIIVILALFMLLSSFS